MPAVWYLTDQKTDVIDKKYRRYALRAWKINSYATNNKPVSITH